MNYLLSLLAKLKEARDFLVTQAPDQLDTAANVLNRIENAIRDASAYLKEVGEGKQVMMGTSAPDDATQAQLDAHASQQGEVRQVIHELRDLHEECRGISGATASTGSMRQTRQKVMTALPPAVAGILIQVLTEVIGQILNRLQPKTA